MNYTKGKWIKQGSFIFSSEKPPRLIAEIIRPNMAFAEQQANATLVAAAPQLFEALKGLAKAYNIYGDGIIFKIPATDNDPVYWHRTVAALAQAEGKE